MRFYYAAALTVYVHEAEAVFVDTNGRFSLSIFVRESAASDGRTGPILYAQFVLADIGRDGGSIQHSLVLFWGFLASELGMSSASGTSVHANESEGLRAEELNTSGLFLVIHRSLRSRTSVFGVLWRPAAIWCGLPWVPKLLSSVSTKVMFWVNDGCRRAASSVISRINEQLATHCR